MLPPPAMAMLNGIGQGSQQAQSMLPSTYQPQGKAYPNNPWQGTLDIIIDQLLSSTKSISEQGDKYRSCVEKLYRAVYDISKVNSELTSIAQEGNESDAG